MSKFDILTKYIPLIQADSIGEWVVDRENVGAPVHPIQMPFVGYSEMVHLKVPDKPRTLSKNLGEFRVMTGAVSYR